MRWRQFAAPPYEIESLYGNHALYPLSDGRFGVRRIEKAASLMHGYRYVLVDKSLATYLRALNVSGTSFRPAVIWDRSTGLDHHSHEQMIFDQRFTWGQMICSLRLGGKRILTVNDEFLFVSRELKEALENSPFAGNLWFSKLRDSSAYLRFWESRTKALVKDLVKALVKKPLARTAVVGDLVDMLCRIRTNVDELVRSTGIDHAPHHDSETSGFVYILGGYAIAESDLSNLDGYRFHVELEYAFANRMAPDSSDESVFQMIRLFEKRLSFYGKARKHRRRDEVAAMTIQFMHFLGYDWNQNVGLYIALYDSAQQHVSALRGFLTRLNSTYYFV